MWPVYKLQICCTSVLIELAPSKWQKVNKHPKLDNNFDIRRQLEHFEYDMNCKLETFARFYELWEL